MVRTLTLAIVLAPLAAGSPALAQAGSCAAYGAGAAPANTLDLACGGAPDIGAAFDLVATGAVSNTVFVGLALSTGHMPLGNGALLINPTQVTHVFSTSASGGDATLSLAIPDNPNLPGNVVYAQAVEVDAGIAGGLALSNGLAVTVGTEPTYTSVELTHVATVEMEVGTHRPEILITDDGEILMLVVQPQGSPGQVGFIKHQGYRFDEQWQQIGDAFTVAQIDATYGEPADHRATLVDDELVVVYQSLNLDPGAGGGPGGGPAEPNALDQTLTLARFDLAGNELFREPIVPLVTDFTEDNFPDHCLLWDEDRLLVSTGSMGPMLKLREVDLEADVLDTHVFGASEGAIPGTIGNSLLRRDGVLSVFSSTSPGGSAMLTLTEIDGDFQETQIASFHDPDYERHFPTGNLQLGGFTFVAHITRERGGPGGLQENPYSASLLVLDPDLEVVHDILVGSGGFAHVHPTLAVSGDRLFVAWSQKATPSGPGPQNAPQVHIEEYLLEFE